LCWQRLCLWQPHFTPTAIRLLPRSPLEVGSALAGQNAVEYVGRVDQNGGNFVSYGYLTHISGLTSTLLFSDILTTTEATARFTYYATATLTSHYVIANVAVVGSATLN
jgi:hypothetical protein